MIEALVAADIATLALEPFVVPVGSYLLSSTFPKIIPSSFILLVK